MEAKQAKAMTLAIGILIDTIKEDLQKVIGDKDVNIGISSKERMVVQIDGVYYHLTWKEIERMRGIIKV